MTTSNSFDWNDDVMERLRQFWPMDTRRLRSAAASASRRMPLSAKHTALSCRAVRHQSPRRPFRQNGLETHGGAATDRCRSGQCHHADVDTNPDADANPYTATCPHIST